MGVFSGSECTLLLMYNLNYDTGKKFFNSSKMRGKTWCYNAVLKCITAVFKFDLKVQCF